ncbi:zinc-dependent alcohol dehydrogenase family protein [Sinorhizobium medicae]|uniref:zinc-dependent alcohol dehydrogenase family protein n=1 Tax=Sinorhizobium medicae TaxID=110321 RepID=UPI000FDC0C82|nr:zinc-binding dehydrogenase [Sinorhizobium medicae]RVO73545.1 iditol 2-dehydrogenase [Sinorhizobium medicae]
MLGVTFPGDREIALLNFSDPTPGVGEVVLEMKASGICGSDLKYYRAPKDIGAFRALFKGLPTVAMRDEGPRIMGHEPCGVVAAIGPGVNKYQAKIGQRVMVHHYSGCTVCEHCRSGWVADCEAPDAVSFGWTAHGGHARYMKVPASTLVPLPDELSYEAGAAISCGSGTSYSALRRMNPNGSHTVVILGQGPVGLSGTQWATAMGCRVIAVDVNNERLNLAKRIGADAVLNPNEVSIKEAVAELTGGRGADFSLECSGQSSAILDAIGCVKRWGTVALVGISPGTTPVNVAADVVVRQINVFGSRTFSLSLMEDCARFAVERRVAIDSIFTDRWALEQAADAYALLDRQSSGKGVFLVS